MAFHKQSSAMSKSLGSAGFHISPAKAAELRRQQNLNSSATISYSGFLWKRSNHPRPVASNPNPTERNPNFNLGPTEPDSASVSLNSISLPNPENNTAQLTRLAPRSALQTPESSLMATGVLSFMDGSGSGIDDHLASAIGPLHQQLLASVHYESAVELPPSADDTADFSNMFFGFSLDVMAQQALNDSQKELYLQQISSASPSIQASGTSPFQINNAPGVNQRTPSKPIQFTSNSVAIPQSDSFEERHHLEPYKSISELSDDCYEGDREQQPDDYIDSNDNHLWRSKYCVLEDGVLYFYSNPTDAKCPEAVAERSSFQQSKPFAPPKLEDLSKSPMQRSRNLITFGGSSRSNADSPVASSSHLWEKRVFLSRVDEVRSAELEFGPNAFVLIATSDNTDPISDDSVADLSNIGVASEGCIPSQDHLVLQAQSPDEMNEWIFQFHRSLAAFLKEFMNSMGNSRVHNDYLDIHHPSLQYSRKHTRHSSINRPLSARLLMPEDTRRFSTSSPRCQPPQLSGSLSHGHGRNALRRRRKDSVSSTCPKFGVSSSFSSALESLQGSQMGKDTPERIPVTISPKFDNTMLLPPRAASPGIPSMPKLVPNVPGKYIPPWKRKLMEQEQTNETIPATVTPYRPPHQSEKTPSGLSLAERVAMGDSDTADESVDLETPQSDTSDELDVIGVQSTPFIRGGCADPQNAEGSVLDDKYIPRKASKTLPTPAEPFGCYSKSSIDTSGSPKRLQWELGAISECGIRNSNEDAYLISSDLLTSMPPSDSPSWKDKTDSHDVSLFAIFDGHCGDQAARFATESLIEYIHEQSKEAAEDGSDTFSAENMENVLRQAISKMDTTFCNVCIEGGRDWESGTTALVTLLADDKLVIANLGDCRGIMVRTAVDDDAYVCGDEWIPLEVSDDSGISGTCYFKEVTSVHCPSRDDEKKRIEEANGWITTEVEIPISQLRRIDFLDQDVIEILRRNFSGRYEGDDSRSSAPQRILKISRICGELAVSRALGDRDFKAAFNPVSLTIPVGPDEVSFWDSSLYLPYPENHSQAFQGDLVSNSPDFQVQKIRVGEKNIQNEFLLLACDGLWDVMDADDAVRVTHDLLYLRKWTAKKAAARLTELAVHLGSPDNITVIIIRFFVA